VRLDKERARLEKHIGGLKGMGSVPQVMIIIDPAQESIAVAEARKLKIPIVATTDTNCNPDLVDYVIPGNDDAIRSVRLLTSALADACVIGMSRRREYLSGKDKGGEVRQSSSGPDAQVIYAGRPRQQHGA
jgi:small subunit ribosomal protein S2